MAPQEPAFEAEMRALVDALYLDAAASPAAVAS